MTKRKHSAGKIPAFHELMNPLLQAMRDLGGSASVKDIHDRVVANEGLQHAAARIHAPERTQQTELEYRLTWARTFLKKYGLLEKREWGVWSLTAQAKRIGQINSREIVRAVQAADKKRRSQSTV